MSALLNPLTMSAWVGKDISEFLDPYYNYTAGFHALPLKNCYLYMTVGLKVTPSFFVQNERIKMPAVELYDLKAGSKQGVRFGFIIRSPLLCLHSKNYLLFYRKQIDPKEIVQKQREAQRKYHIGNLLFFALEDEAVFISQVESGPFIESLEA